MNTDKAKALLQKFKDDTLTEDERALVESWYNSLPDAADADALSGEALEKELQLLREGIPYLKRKSGLKALWPKIAVAASVVLLVGVGSWLFINHQHQDNPPQMAASEPISDVSPGKMQATLTLADGRKVVLKNGLTGTIAAQGNSLVQAGRDGSVQYANQSGNTAAVVYNTLSTAMGEQSPFPLVLADGTKVWLNAASSLRFPSGFTGSERVVALTGEAYFEVAHNAAQPFKVQVNGMEVQDIGTSFDINGYSDEPAMQTTLIAGAARVVKQDHSVLLKPGQQAVAGAARITVRQVNTDEVIAWKNGIFRFDATDLKTIMRQLARWYDLKVIYKGTVTNDVFDGNINRDRSLADVLRLLQSNDIHYRLQSTGGQKELIITQ